LTRWDRGAFRKRWAIFAVVSCGLIVAGATALAGSGPASGFTSFGAPFTGANTLISNLPGSSSNGVGPTGLLEVGSTLYTVDTDTATDTATLYRFGLDGGDAAQAAQVVSSQSELTNGLAESDGVFYAGSSNEEITEGVYRFNPATLARGPEVAPIQNVNEIAVDPNTGDLYVTAANDGLYRIQDPSSDAHQVTEVAVGDFAGLGFTSDGQDLWVADDRSGDPSVEEFRVSDLQTASSADDCTTTDTADCATPEAGSDLPTSNPQQEPIGIAVYPSGSTVGGTDVSGDLIITTAQGNTDAPGEVMLMDPSTDDTFSVVASGDNATRGDAAIIDPQGNVDLAQTTSVVQLAPAAAPQTYVVGGSGPSGVGTLDEAVNDAGASSATNVLIQLPGNGNSGNDGTKYPVSGLRIDPPPGATWTIEGEGNTADEVEIEQLAASSQVPDLIIGSTSGRSGQVNLDDVMVSGADDTNEVGAGGIEVEPGASLDLDDSFIDGNSTAGNGGGILDQGALTVENSTISDNGADGGYGGGIDYAQGAAGEIVNSTIVNNHAGTQGGGIAGSSTAPTTANDPGVDVLNSTIAGNNGGTSGGIYGYAVANLVGTILGEQTSSSVPNCNTIRSGISGGYNIADDSSCNLNASTDRSNTDPMLDETGGFATLGGDGPTPVVYPATNSPAQTTQRADCPATDQRGAPRKANTGPCDVGAAESGVAAPVIGCPPAQDAYAVSVLSNSPLVYYPLNESAGLFACDVTDDNIGTYASSGVGYGVPGPLLSDPGETAISGDGTDSNGPMDGGSVPLTGNASFTLEGWFQAATPINETVATLDGGSVAGMAVWSTHTACGAGSNNNGSALALDEHGVSNCWDTAPDSINLFDGSWHYLVIAYDASANTMTGYVDGVDLGAETPDTSFSWSSPEIELGFWVDHSVNQPFTGNMAQAAVYPTALSAADVSASFAAAGYGTGTTTTGTTTTGTTTTGTTTTGTTTTGTTTTGTTTTGTTTTGTTTTGTTTTGTTTTGTTTTTPPPPPPPPPPPDLSISVSQTQSFTAGSTSAYDVQVDNRGTGDSSGPITVTATLPAGVSYQSAGGNWSCVQGGAVQTVTCTYSGGAIAAGQGASLQLKVAVAANATNGTASFTVSDSDDSDKGDKTATSPTTIVPAGSVGATFAGPGMIAAGGPSSFNFALSNLGQTAIASGANVNFAISQTGAAQLTLAPHAAGTGWNCSTVTTGSSAVVHCTASQALAPGASTSLALSFDPPLSAAGTAASVTYTLLSSGGATLASGKPETLSVTAPSPAVLTARIVGPSALTTSASDYGVAVSNTGSGATTGSTVVTLAAPSQIKIGTVASGGWTCKPATARLVCTDISPIAAGKSAPALVVPLTGTAGAGSPDAVGVSVASSDAQGSITAHASVTVAQPVTGSSAPVIKIQTVSSSTTSSSYSVTVSNTGDGASGSTPLSLTESLPAGVTATTNGPGWTCSQKGTTLFCSYSPASGAVLGAGASTPPLQVKLTGVADFVGESIPITTTSVLTTSDGVGHSVSIGGSVGVEAKPAPASVQATLSTAVSSTSPGSQVPTTFGVQTGPSAIANSGVVVVALVLPQGLTAPTSIYWHDDVLISPDDQIPAQGSTAAPVPVAGSSGAPGMTCQGFITYVVCAAANVAPNSEINVEGVPIGFASTVAGSQTLTAGVVPVTATTTSGAITAASAAIAANNMSALQSPQTTVVDVPVFAAYAGTIQRLSALSGSCAQSSSSTGGSTPTLGSGRQLTLVGSTPAPSTGCTLDSTLTPTSVNLDGSGTVGDGKPLTYKWVQTSGPAVTWSPAAAGETPGQGGSTLPAFPSTQFTLKSVGSPSYGPRVSFTYAGAANLRKPVQFGFTLEVTDGAQVRTATTTVELDPPAPSPPATPKLCMWDYTQTKSLVWLPTTAGCLSATSPAPKPGDIIIAGSYSPLMYDTDAAGDALTYAWSVTQPTIGTGVSEVGWHLTPANGSSAPSICRQPAAVAQTGPAFCFEWPSGVSVLGLQAKINNGQTDANGNPESSVAAVTYGSAPAPLTVSIPTSSTPAVAGSSVSLTAAATTAGGNAVTGATYVWTQNGGPAVSGLPSTTSSATLKFTAPSPTTCAGASSTGCGQQVTVSVTATGGSGLAASTGQTSVTIPLAAAPAPGISLTGPGENASGQVPLSGPGQVTLSTSLTGVGAGASYLWSVVSGGGSVAPSASGTSATYTSAAAGIASVSVTVTPAGGGNSVSATIPIVTAGSSSSSSSGGVCTGLLGSIINQVFPSGVSVPKGTAVLDAGPVTLDLPLPTLSGSGTIGSSGIGCTLPSGDTLNFADATVTVGPLTLSNLSASVSLTQITLSAGTVTAPSSWGIGQGTISQAIVIPLDGTSAPTGAVTWTQSSTSSGLPVLPAGSTVTNATTTVTLGASALTLTASANVLSGTVQASATIPLSSSASQPPCPSSSSTPSTPGSWCLTFSTSKSLQVLGTSVSGSGTLTYGSSGFSGSFTATAGSVASPIDVGPVKVTSATLTWNSSGISLSASGWALGTAANPIVTLSFSGDYQDSDNWSATATGTVKNNPQGLPSGVSLLNASVSGSVVDQNGNGPIFDVKLSDPSPLTINAGSVASLSFTNFALEISNGPASKPCQEVNLPASGGDLWLTLGGTASVKLGSTAPASVSATACVDPESGSFGVYASGFDNWSPGGGVSFTSLNLAVSDVNGQFQAVAGGGLTVDGITATGAVAFTSDGDVIAMGAIPQLSQLGVPLPNTAGVAVFSTADIQDLGTLSQDSTSEQAVLPEMFCLAGSGSWSGSGCTGSSLTEGSFANVTVNQDGLTLAASFSLPTADANDLNTALGLDSSDAINPELTVSVDLGADVPTITGSLSAPNGGFTVLHVGPNTTGFPLQIGPLKASEEKPGSAFTLNLQSIEIQLGLDGSLSLGAQATVTMPAPTPSGATPAQGAPAPTSCAVPGSTPQNSSDDCEQLGLAAAITLDVDGPTITLAGTVDGCNAGGVESPLCNAFGVNGLDIGNLSVQMGLDFSTTPIPTPTFGFAAAINTIPCSWAGTIGYSESGCSGSSGTPTLGPTPAMSIAVNLSDTGPIFAFQIGAPNSTTPTLRFGNALTVDEAGLVIAPAGGTIGAGPDAVTYQPGFSLSFNGAVMGVPLLVKASVNPTAGTISACAAVGTISIGGLTVSNASFDFALGVSTANQCAGPGQLSSTQVNPAGGAAAGLVLGFTGDISVAGSATASVALSLQATAGGTPTVSFSADVGNLNLFDNTVDLNSLVLTGTGTFGSNGLSFSLAGSASMSVLGNSINVAGSVALTSDGIQSLSFYANPANTQFKLAGADLASLTGPGCFGQSLPASVPTAISHSTSGACVGVSYSGSGSTAFQVTLDATAQVAGIAVTFYGTAGTTGIDISRAYASIPGIGSIALSGQLWLDSGTLGAAGGGGSGAGNLAGTQWLDPVSGQEVNVQPGDFEFGVSTPTPITLAGISLNVNFQFGSVGSDVYAVGSSELTLPGGAYVNLNGRFCASNGNFGFQLGASLSGTTLDGFNLGLNSSATLTNGAQCLGPLSGPTGLTYQVAFDPSPITDPFGNTVTLQASASGSVTENNDEFSFSFDGHASLQLYGVTLSAGFDWSSSGTGLPSLPLDGNQLFGSGINFSGSTTVASDGSVCGLNGSATIVGITGTATFCDSGGSAALTVSLSDADLAISGTVDGPTWSLTADGKGSLSINDLLNLGGTQWGVDSTAGYDVDVTVSVSPTGVNVNLGKFNASGSVNAVVAGNSIGLGSVSISGQPGDVCGTASNDLGSAEVCDDKGTVEIDSLEGPFSSTPPVGPFPPFPWVLT
jgi:hypothetical protein